MALLLSCQGIGKAYGAVPLFEDLSFGIFDGDRIGLVGPNGSGKSTLLRILAGVEAPDRGTRSLRRGIQLGWVPQDATFPAGRSVQQIVSQALDGEPVDEAEKQARIAVVLGKMGLADPAAPVETLSGGQGKRLAIARELVREPDLLLLDEPTNHLDLDGILWLERLLAAEPTAYLVISHDRTFLDNVTGRMLEVDRRHAAGFLDVAGGYRRFLAEKEAALRGQAQLHESLANQLRRETAWLRRGPKARTTKSQARIDRAGRLATEVEDLAQRDTQRTARIDFTASERRTRRLLVAEGVVKHLGGRTVLEGVDLTLAPGTRLGLVGPNGSGKTTLLRLLAGELEPDAGTIERAPGLRVVYFDQRREQLDPQITLRRSLAPDGDQVVFRDRPVHVAGWAKRFLFRSEQLEMVVGRMSGGERARVLIARLMLRPADLLILDEPTNDLDIPTLEVLEESLIDFPGALVLVSHDRSLLESVANRVLALDGSGRAEPFADCEQWEQARRRRASAERAAPVLERQEARERRSGEAGASPPAAGPKRLSYNEKREWERMEESILAAEQALEACRRAALDPAIAADAGRLQQRYRELQAAQEEVDRLFARWAELEAKQG